MASGLRSTLGRALRDVRERAGSRQIDIAARASVHESVVGNFERGQHIPERLDDILDAYSVELRLSRPDLLRLVADFWEGEEDA